MTLSRGRHRSHGQAEMQEIEERARRIPAGPSRGRARSISRRRAVTSTAGPTSATRLRANNVISGPAIVEQMDTTTVLPPGETAKVDRFGTLIVSWPPSERVPCAPDTEGDREV